MNKTSVYLFLRQFQVKNTSRLIECFICHSSATSDLAGAHLLTSLPLVEASVDGIIQLQIADHKQ